MKFSCSELSRTTWSVRCRTWNSECCLFYVIQFNSSCLVSESTQGFHQMMKQLLAWRFIIWSEDLLAWIGVGTQRWTSFQQSDRKWACQNLRTTSPPIDQSKWAFVHFVLKQRGSYPENNYTSFCPSLKTACMCLLCGALCSTLFANERRECSPAHLTSARMLTKTCIHMQSKITFLGEIIAFDVALWTSSANSKDVGSPQFVWKEGEGGEISRLQMIRTVLIWQSSKEGTESEEPNESSS